MVTTLQSRFTPYDISNTKLPPEGPRVIPARLRWEVDQSFFLDLTYAVGEQKQLSYVQTVMVDNRLNTGVVNVQEAGIPFVLAVAPGAQAFLPILSAQSPKITVTNTVATGETTCFFLNFPVSPIQWSSENPAFIFDGDGCLKVADCNLLPLIGNWSGNGDALAVTDLGLFPLINDAGFGDALNVNVVSGGGGGGGGGAAIITSSIADCGASLNETLYTPSAGNKFVLVGLEVQAIWNENNANGGNLNWSVLDASAGGQTIASGQIYGRRVRALAGQNDVLYSNSNLNYTGKVADGLLRFNGGVNSADFVKIIAHLAADVA